MIQPTAPERRAGKELFLLLPFLLCMLVLINHVAMVPPPVKQSDAPTEVFSAARALDRLQDLLAENVPHAAGTPENQRVKRRIMDQLHAMQVDPVVQSAFTCRKSNRVSSVGCAYVDNILVRLPGRNDGPAVVLSAHYDSQPSAPGASDAGTAVVTLLEVLDRLRADAPFNNPIVFLFNEAEEIALFGANAALDHAYLENVGVVLNFEARGTRGQSVMFETSEPNAWLLDVYGAAATYPATSSLYFEVYKLIPNDTDLTVYKQAGLPGMNFAYAENEPYYHTPFDNVANLDPRSLQHHGENALHLARAFGNYDFSQPRSGNAVYMDLLGLGILIYPEGLAVPLALGFTMILLVFLVLGTRRGLFTTRQLAWAMIAHVILGAVVVLGSIMIARTVILLSGSVAPWYANPVPMRVATWVNVFFACGLAALAFSRRTNYWALLFANWSVFAVLGVMVAMTLPGIGILFGLPLGVLLAALGALRMVPGKFTGPWSEFILLVPVVVQVLVWTQIAEVMDHALGPGAVLFIAVPLFMAALAVLPLFAIDDRELVRNMAIGSAGIVIAAMVAAIFMPAYTDEYPQQVSVTYLEDTDREEAWYLLAASPSELPRALESHAEFADVAEDFFKTTFGRRYVAKTTYAGLAETRFVVTSDRIDGEHRIVRGRFESSAAAFRHRLFFPEASRPVSVSINNVTRKFDADRPYRGYHLFSCATAKCNEDEIELRFQNLETFSFVYREQRLGLPESAAELKNARDEFAVPHDTGDTSQVVQTITLPGLPR